MYLSDGPTYDQGSNKNMRLRLQEKKVHNDHLILSRKQVLRLRCFHAL
jgi:hypothetical protein